MSEAAVKQFTNSQLIYLITLFLLLGFLAFFIYSFLSRTYEAVGISVIIIFIVSFFIPKILLSVERSQNLIKPVDYVILSDYYQNRGDHIRAAEFLKQCKEIDSENIPPIVLDSLNKKILNLQMKGIGN